MSTGDPRRPDLYQLESAAKEHLDNLVDKFENLLTAVAARKAPGRPIEVHDLDQAYSELDVGDREPLRDTQQIISRAIRENRAGEWVVYVMAGALFLVGLFLLILGGWRGDLASVVAGAAAEVLFLLPLRMAYNTRSENLRLRVLGILLDRGGNARTMAAILRQAILGPDQAQE